MIFSAVCPWYGHNRFSIYVVSIKFRTHTTSALYKRTRTHRNTWTQNVALFIVYQPQAKFVECVPWTEPTNVRGEPKQLTAIHTEQKKNLNSIMCRPQKWTWPQWSIVIKKTSLCLSVYILWKWNENRGVVAYSAQYVCNGGAEKLQSVWRSLCSLLSALAGCPCGCCCLLGPTWKRELMRHANEPNCE